MTLNIYGVGSIKGVRYYVDYPEGRLHILNERSLVWNLKRVFGLSEDDLKIVMYGLNENGKVSVVLKLAA